MSMMAQSRVPSTVTPDNTTPTADTPDTGLGHPRPYNLGLDEVIAALPDAVKEAMQKAIPEKYTPEFAEKFAATMIAIFCAEEQNADGPRRFTFTNRLTGEEVTVRCMDGCTLDHNADTETPSYPADVYCHIFGDDATLPVDGPLCEGNGPEEFRVLGWHIDVTPFSSQIVQRQPVVTVEVLDDHCIEDLDPDGLTDVIDVLQARVDSLRNAHTQLVELRAAYQAATGTSA